MPKQVMQYFHSAFKMPKSSTFCISKASLLMQSFHIQLSSAHIILLFPGILAEKTFHLEQFGIFQNQKYLLFSAVLSLVNLGNGERERERFPFSANPGFSAA